MRAFFCIELDEATQNELERIIRRLRQQMTARVTWVRRENLHVTLKFLGEIDSASLEPLTLAAKEALQGLSPFQWELNRLGAFPHSQRPRVIWAGCRKEPQPLQTLHAALEAQLELLGFAPDRGAFTAHVTLGRVKQLGPRPAELAQALESLPSFAYPMRTEGITMMESRLTPTGAHYRPCFQLALPDSKDHAL